MTTPKRKPPKVVEAPVETKPNSDEFQAKFNPDTQTAQFSLIDGTPVEIKSPKAKQFLLLDSFINHASEEYKTESFIFLKLASLCITSFGDKDSISFEELVDLLEIEDIERIGASMSFFRDKFDYLSRKSSNV
ncbi:hypothetical protein [Picosynechococcus sp. PCC 7117]|uniref:hypothetical protein n=1 Tax=Picosynechococcus sp. PCC 7117 TaxID=195498 RepID=UPI000810D2C1|nr:hypothetical protein [Picosynechococcus sp. PCC 7117]ANV88495.1 hypothetical protein AWQ22_14065 [Picosynechococcus sp. PCC 7117]